MEKASRTLLRIAVIFGTILGALVLACVPCLIVLGASPAIKDMLVEAITSGDVNVHSDFDLTAEQIATLIQVVLLVTAGLLIYLGAICVANAIISSKARNNPTEGLMIAAIITGALSTDFSLVGGIFGLICVKRRARRKQIEE